MLERQIEVVGLFCKLRYTDIEVVVDFAIECQGHGSCLYRTFRYRLLFCVSWVSVSILLHLFFNICTQGDVELCVCFHPLMQYSFCCVCLKSKLVTHLSFLYQ